MLRNFSLFGLFGLNIAAICVVSWQDIANFLGITQVRLSGFLKFTIVCEMLIVIFVLMLLIQNRSVIMRKFIGIRLTYRVMLGFAIGSIFGFVLRIYPEFFSSIGMEPDSFRILGKIFIDLIKMIVGPLVFASITCSIMGSKDDSSRSTSILTIKSVTCFLLMTLVAVSLGVFLTAKIQPGKRNSIDVANIINANQSEVKKIQESGVKLSSLSDFILDVIPDNVFKSFNSNNFLQIIFFSTLFGIAIRNTKQQDKIIGKAMIAINDIMFKITDIVMQVAPLSVFGITAWVVGSQDIELIKSLGIIICIVYLGTIFMVYFIYGAAMFSLKLNPIKFYQKMWGSQLSGFLLASSSAILPNTLKVAHDKLGISKSKSLFIIPLGATINMNGTALNLGVSVVFIAQLFGVNFTIYQYLCTIIYCTLGAIGTAPVPGASIFLLASILSILGLPIEAVGIILAIDRVLDMARTFGNISGDVFSAVIVDRLDNTLDVKKWNS